MPLPMALLVSVISVSLLVSCVQSAHNLLSPTVFCSSYGPSALYSVWPCQTAQLTLHACMLSAAYAELNLSNAIILCAEPSSAARSRQQALPSQAHSWSQLATQMQSVRYLAWCSYTLSSHGSVWPASVSGLVPLRATVFQGQPLLCGATWGAHPCSGGACICPASHDHSSAPQGLVQSLLINCPSPACHHLSFGLQSHA